MKRIIKKGAHDRRLSSLGKKRGSTESSEQHLCGGVKHGIDGQEPDDSYDYCDFYFHCRFLCMWSFVLFPFLLLWTRLMWGKFNYY